jgi:ABC-type transport system substrate-binding protein
MSLLTPNEAINASLAADAKSAAQHIASAASLANRMVASMMQLNDHQLTAWLNSRDPADTMAIFAAHGQLGEAINGAATVASSVLSASGINYKIEPVDVRSVADKLAGAGRVLDFADGVWSVTTPPPPEPNPDDHPEPDPYDDPDLHPEPDPYGDPDLHPEPDPYGDPDLHPEPDPYDDPDLHPEPEPD